MTKVHNMSKMKSLEMQKLNIDVGDNHFETKADAFRYLKGLRSQFSDLKAKLSHDATKLSQNIKSISDAVEMIGGETSFLIQVAESRKSEDRVSQFKKTHEAVTEFTDKYHNKPHFKAFTKEGPSLEVLEYIDQARKVLENANSVKNPSFFSRSGHDYSEYFRDARADLGESIFLVKDLITSIQVGHDTLEEVKSEAFSIRHSIDTLNDIQKSQAREQQRAKSISVDI